MQTLTITSINRYNKTAKSSGKPFVSVALKAQEYGDRTISGFGNKENEHWVVGDIVEVEVETKGEYLNFTMPKGSFQKAGAGFTPSGDLLRVERKLDDILTKYGVIQGFMGDIKGVLGGILRKVDPAVQSEEPPF